MERASIPTQHEYYHGLLSVLGWPWLCACAAVCASCVLTSLLGAASAVLRTDAAGGVRRPTALVVAVYPVVGACSLVALACPRGQLLAEAAVQVVIALCMHQYFLLLLRYGAAPPLQLAVPPCCCWPCCHSMLPTPKSTRFLHVLVGQLPVVQTLVYSSWVALLELDLGSDVLQYWLQSLALVSILGAVWGLSSAVRLVPTTPDLRPRAKFLALQTLLVLSKLQALLARATPHVLLLQPPQPFTTQLAANMVYDVAMLVEVALLSVWARSLYSSSSSTKPPAGPAAVVSSSSLGVKVIAA